MSNTLKQLQRAKEIVDRYIERGCVFPRELRDCGRTDPVRQQGKGTLSSHINALHLSKNCPVNLPFLLLLQSTAMLAKSRHGNIL